MRRLLVLPLLAILAWPVWAQESGDPETEEADGTEAAADPSEDDTEDGVEDDGIDDDIEAYSEVDEDEFIPSEDVGFGQNIVFPTDI